LATIQVHRKHQLDLPDIRSKAESLANSLADKFGGKFHWQDDQLFYLRSGVDACISCGSDDISVEIKLGMMMSAIRGTIETEVNNSLDKYLG
jgi:putative polyhydroxyalkanoate system protein